MNEEQQKRDKGVFVICSRGGCGHVSNGIAPWDYCPTHYRSYQGWLAERDHLVDALTYAEQEELREVLSRTGRAGVDFIVFAPDVEERVNAALDLIGEVAGDSLYEREAAA